MAVQVTIQEYARAINSSWHKTTDSVLETARFCAEVEKKLRPEEKNKLFKDLDFNKATFSKLAKIGSQPRLQTEAVKSLLPPNYTIVYEVAKLPESDLQVAIKEGIISPKMLRSDLDAWLEKRMGKVPTSESEHAKIIATVEVPSDYDPKKQALLQKALEKLQAQFGFSLERPRDPEEMAFNRMAARVDDHIRKEARRFIHTLKTSRVQAAGRISAAERKNIWPFSDDEIAIAPDATWEQVKAALELVGNADEFERLRDEALRLCGVPEERVSDHPMIDHDEAMAEIREATEKRLEGDLVLRIPLYQDKKRTLFQIAELLDQNGAGERLADMKQGQFHLSVGVSDGHPIHPSTRFLRNLSKVKLLMHFYRFWLEGQGLGERQRLEQTAKRYFAWADAWNRKVRERKWKRPLIEIPYALTEYVAYLQKRGDRRRVLLRDLNITDAPNHRRQIARYIRKARRLAENVGRGEFPGNYEGDSFQS